MLREIPLTKDITNQRIGTTVNNQNITISLYQRGALYADIYKDNILIIGGARCVHASYINDYRNDNFNGYLFFFCDNGLDPNYTNLGTVSHLLYSDTDALAGYNEVWVAENLAELMAEFPDA